MLLLSSSFSFPIVFPPVSFAYLHYCAFEYLFNLNWNWRPAWRFPFSVFRFRPRIMEAAYLSSAEDALRHFEVNESHGLSERQIRQAVEKFGRNGTVHTCVSAVKRSMKTKLYFP